MADSYVCSGAVMRCSFGTSTARLQVLPDRTVWLAGQLMGNISDHRPGANIPGFGRCRTVSYPPTGSATAANHGRLTPMPCLPGTIANWLMGKNDYLIQGLPALLRSSRCMCQWGGVITITDDGQHAEGTQWVRKEGKQNFNDEKVVTALAPVEMPKNKPTEKELANLKLPTALKEKISNMSPENYSALFLKIKQKRMRVAHDFYVRQGFNPDDIPSHLNGIDFNHPVAVVEVPPPDKLIQRTYDTNLGNYFTHVIRDKQTNEERIPTANECGTKDMFRDRETGHLKTKKLKEFDFKDVSNSSQIVALQSTAATIVDDWSDKYNPKRTCGGAPQLFIPLNDEQKRKINATAKIITSKNLKS